MISLLLTLLFQPDSAMLRRVYEENLARQQKRYGMNDPHTAAAWRDLGLFLRQNSDLSGAHTALQKALAIDETLLSASDTQTLEDAASLARVSPPAEAQPLWTRVSAGPNAELSAEAFAALGDMREAAGDNSAAAEFFRSALQREESASGKTAAKVAVRLNSLALVLTPRDAVPLLRRALLIDRQAWGEKHPETATTEVNLSGELLASGQSAEAVRTGTTALAGFEATLGGDHPRTAAAASTLADALHATRQNARAEKLYRQALAIDERAYGPSHPETLGDVGNLAGFLREIGRTAEANELDKRLCLSGGPCK